MIIRSYVVGETHGSEAASIRATAELWRAGVTAFVGPQRTCAHEARMAASFNLPMISHFCEEAETSDKVSDELICVTGSYVGYSDTVQTKENSVWL